MKFKDKLPKLRKNNNITQEQLADLLGVSRQAVSKWESGLSIPDMEKIIEMCKIFNCQIEELLDDGVTSNRIIEKDKTLKEYINSILSFITKTYKMFCSMKFFEKLKCLYEVALIIGIQILCYFIIGAVLGTLLGNIINFLPWQIYDFFSSIGWFIYVVVSIIIGTIITIHLFKVRYLNYFVIVKDTFEKTTLEEKEILDKPKETIIIRDTKHQTHFLKKVFTIFFKFCSILLIIPFLLSFVILTFFTIFTLFYLWDGLIFMGIICIFLGCLMINYIFLEILYKYVFNFKNKLKKIFIILITSLLLIGSGSAFAVTSYLSFIKVDNNISYKEATYKVPLNDQKKLFIYNIDKENIVIDNEEKDLKITIEYLSNKPTISYYDEHYYCDDNQCYSENINYLDIYSQENFIFYINLILKDFKNKNTRNYNELRSYKIKEIKISEDNLDKIAY